MSTITNETQYETTMNRIEYFLKKATSLGGFANLSPNEVAELQTLSIAAEQYEDRIPLAPIVVQSPQSLPEMLSLKMYQMKLKQKDLAHLLNITPTRLSEVMSGKRRVNMDLAKRLYKKLSIDPAFILEHS
ncbi:helix-turn-helix domain-containing protein [Runella sp. MFBS21]|uniref:helix-turn-helix domain-containing protein n=1 Tax=Runella sp. MFBS21 TaxID=3034018 RepID=UPI0023F74E84|nr:helix-turn-helix domain-containing protein [Runella sp. MFBS21]MDF7820269.1 helix-turn-helix domain-containing protein [Runella sp. MFBS21]